MNAVVRGRDEEGIEDERPVLQQICEDAVRQCLRAGASDAQVRVVSRRLLQVGVRLGEVETLTRKRERTLVVVAYRDGRKGQASTGDTAAGSIATTVGKACAIARRTEPDACNGLPDAYGTPGDAAALDLWHPWTLTPQQAIELAQRAEAAGRAHDPRITHSNGAEVSAAATQAAQADSSGFRAAHRGTWQEMSAAFVASDAAGMQSRGWYDGARAPEDLWTPEAVGRHAATLAVARLGHRPLGTRRCPVLFAPDMAVRLLGTFLSAVSGASVYRRASFLADSAGQPVFPAFVGLHERPHLRRGPGSRLHDDEGVASVESPIVVDGVLQRYLLDSYAARRLGAAGTGNAGGHANVEITPGPDDFQALLARMGTGLVVTGLMGHGVSLVSGDYSNGASGHWVENGEIAHPVDGITIAGNLKAMFAGIVAVGNDIDGRFRLRTGSLLIDAMTVAGA